jgi:hypothetical protein
MVLINKLLDRFHNTEMVDGGWTRASDDVVCMSVCCSLYSKVDRTLNSAGHRLNRLHHDRKK